MLRPAAHFSPRQAVCVSSAALMFQESTETNDRTMIELRCIGLSIFLEIIIAAELIRHMLDPGAEGRPRNEIS
jgi:hypothetical protein